MRRRLLTARWLTLTALLLGAVGGMLWLGQWQWQRSAPETAALVEDPSGVAPAALPAVGELVGVGERVVQGDPGRLVRVRGEWVPERTLFVADRAAPGEPDVSGRWVVTAVRVGEGAAGGGGDGDVLVPVVRGWVPADPDAPAGTAPAPPAGPVEVVGWLQAAEPLDLPVDIVQPDGVVPILATADLVNRWPEELLGGFVVAAPGSSGLTADPLTAPPESARESRDWRNLAYSAQWFVFAGFAVVLWWRMLRDDVARSEASAEAAARDRARVPAGPVPVQTPRERSAP
ncbi:SURF1 family protein [Aquipuribacter nitratireducens]|uniref:SURF1-like protein n=1 Tax=Aquipuribacter nitratireducens TaxID=650104 RepID=A0ABW0GLZ0_9MICO